MSFTEKAFCFDCSGDTLLGIVAMPEVPAPTGILIVVGGPQYRIGSHRQFLLLSRALAAKGYVVMRFDVRGMGDSCGGQRSFDALQDDIGAAIQAFQQHCPSIQRVVLWGLCDAASASMLYRGAIEDPRIRGLVLLNPWVRSQSTLARAHIKHYYGQRLFQAEFWRKLIFGRLGIAQAVVELIRNAVKSCMAPASDSLTFQHRMASAMHRFDGPVLVILSSEDYIAKEYLEAIKSDPAWAGIPDKVNVTHTTVAGADHTFSSAGLRKQAETLTLQWLQEHATV